MPPQLRFFLRREYLPVSGVVALSFLGALAYGNYDNLYLALADRWSLSYFLLSPFVHAGAAHFIFNALALHFIGGQMLLPVLRARRFLLVFGGGVLAATAANNLLSPAPAVGISAGVMALLACALFPFGGVRMRLLLVHDLLPFLPSFALLHVAAFVVCLDIVGIVLGWHFFAHWAHLAGFAVGLALGARFFGAPPWWRVRRGRARRQWRQ